MYDVVIVGAGASGLMCASMIKKDSKLNVLVLEHNDKVGKKLSMTGNGRCNLGNINKKIDNYFSLNNLDNFKNYLVSDSYLKSLNEIGILIKEDSGRLYPYNNQAISVCKSFEKYLLYKKVNIKYNYDVNSIIKDNDLYIINNDIKTRKVVIATGGISYPKTGSTGKGYEILKSFGHNISKLYPALTYLKTNYKYIKELMGVRWDGIASLIVDNKVIDTEKGQIQFTKDSVSGVCIFNLSLNVKKYLELKKQVKISINLLPEYNKKEVNSYLNSFSLYKIEDALEGLLNNKLAKVVCKNLKISNKLVKDLNDYELGLLFNKLYNYEFNIIDTGSYDVSQITYGGALLNEFNNSLESLNNKGLYAIGEVLDVSGKCGGYNLSWAFNSAMIVGDAIKKDCINK